MDGNALLDATQCAICLDNLFVPDDQRLGPPRVLGCGHIFHLLCIQNTIRNNRNRCPLCRAYIWMFNVRPFYLPGIQRLIEGLQPPRPQNRTVPYLFRSHPRPFQYPAPFQFPQNQIRHDHVNRPAQNEQNVAPARRNQRQNPQNGNQQVRNTERLAMNVNRPAPNQPNVAQARRQRLNSLPAFIQRNNLQRNHDRQNTQPHRLNYVRLSCLICSHEFISIDDKVICDSCIQRLGY